MDRLVVALHVLDFLRQMLLQIHPVRRILANALRIGDGRRAHLLLPRQQRFGARLVASPVLLFQLLQFRQGLPRRRQRTGSPAQPVWILPCRRQGTEQIALAGQIPRDIGLCRLHLRLCRRERFSFRRDLRLDIPRQSVEAGEQNHDNADGQQHRQKTQ